MYAIRSYYEVYQKPFTVVSCLPEDVPPVNERVMKLGGHLDGYRIGFDLGASDLKVSAIVEGKAVVRHPDAVDIPLF